MSSSCLWLPQKALSTMSTSFPPGNPWVREKEDRALGGQSVNVSAGNQWSLRGEAVGEMKYCLTAHLHGGGH